MRVDAASRVIRAPREPIYRALVDREAVVRWLPPAGAHATLHLFEPWPCGAFRMTLTFDGPSDGTKRKTTENSDAVDGRFVELVPPRSVVQQFEFVSEHPEFAGTMTMTWTLSEVPTGTLVNVAATHVPRGLPATDHQRGMESSLENLASFIEGGEARRSSGQDIGDE